MNVKRFKCLGTWGLGLFLMLGFYLPTAWPAEKRPVEFRQFENAKAFLDDPRPFLKQDLNPKNYMSPEDYAQLTYNVEDMKKLWAEIVGIKAPEVVGKIAPEIKPGKYSYQDKEKYPGFKELLPPWYYEKFAPGAPPLALNFPEMEIVPTRQYYHALPYAEATKKYMGTAKLDDQGYLVSDSWVAGIPFPRPSGNFKAQQVMYNWEKRSTSGDEYTITQMGRGYDRNLKMDYELSGYYWMLRLCGRTMTPPFGWYDERAKDRGERSQFVFQITGPRDQYGNVIAATKFTGLNDYDQMLVYIAALRRVRKLSGTDSQDTVAGSDSIYEDYEGFDQKLTPTRFPYKFEILAEQEYLFPVFTEDGSAYYSGKGLEFHNLKFERRPCYVIQLTSQDKNFIYGRRVIYLDAENFFTHIVINYDQKGRLYRTNSYLFGFYPEMGIYSCPYVNAFDHIDYHTTLSVAYILPSPWVTRANVSMQTMIKKGK